MKRCRYFLFTFTLLVSSILVALDKPDFSHKRNFYEAPFELILNSDTDNSTIKYTLDGSKPGKNRGIVYNGTISISKTTCVRAVTIADDTVSEVRTHTFIFLNDIIQQDDSGLPQPQHSQDHVYWTEEFDMNDVTQTEDEIKEAFKDIPTISISSSYDSLFGIAGILRGQNLREGSGGLSGDPNDPNWHELVECSIEMIYPDNEKFEKYKSWQENAGIKVQGGGGRWNNGYYDHKQSFTLEFKSIYGAGTLRNDIFKAAPFNSFSSPQRFDKIILRAGHNKSWGADWDRENTVYTRDQFGRDLQLLMSGWGSHGTFVHLYLNGKYWGLYNPCERMDDNAMSIYFGGEDDDYYFGKGKGGDQAGSDDRYDYLRNTNWSNVQLSALSEYLAIDEYIDICLLYCYANPGDGPQYYFANRNNPTGPMYYTAWDMEDSFEGGSRRTGPPISSEDINFEVYSKVRNNVDFKMKFADRTYKHCYNNGVLTDQVAGSIWDSLCSNIELAILCEIARWGDERGAVNDYEHWHKEWQDVKDDISGRRNKLITALKNAGMYPSVRPPVFYIGSDYITGDTLRIKSSIQLTVRADASAETLFYTIDGSDPRNWDLTGVESPTAIQSIGRSVIVTINNSTIIKTRSRRGSEWSPLKELTIIPDSTISSVMNNNKSDSNLDYILFQNYPNPFNPSTEIRFQIPHGEHVKISVFNILGQLVAILIDEELNRGSHRVKFDSKNLPAGIYFYNIKTDDFVQVKKMILLK